MERPVSVTVVAWIIIVTSMQSMLSAYAGLLRPDITLESTLISEVFLVGVALNSLIVVFAIFILKAKNWARVAYVCIASIWLLSMIHNMFKYTMAIHTISTAIQNVACFYILFRPISNRYFSSKLENEHIS